MIIIIITIVVNIINVVIIKVKWLKLLLLYYLLLITGMSLVILKPFFTVNKSIRPKSNDSVVWSVL